MGNCKCGQQFRLQRNSNQAIAIFNIGLNGAEGSAVTLTRRLACKNCGINNHAPKNLSELTQPGLGPIGKKSPVAKRVGPFRMEYKMRGRRHKRETD